jgi:hypothetical protein
LTAEDFKENASFGLQFNSLVSDTKGSAKAQCSDHMTARIAVSSNRVAPSRFGYTASIPDAPVLLKSNRSQRFFTSFRSHLATKSRELSKTFMASGSEVTGTSKMPELGSERSQRLAEPSSQLSVNCKELGRSQRHEIFMNQLSTESDELGKVCVLPDSNGAEISNIYGFIEYNRSQRMLRSTSKHAVESSEYSRNVASDYGAIGALDRIRFLEPQKLETSAGQSKSEESDKAASHGAGTSNLREPFLCRSDKSTRMLGATSQNEMESHSKALADNHEEMETKYGSAVLMPTQLQSDVSCTQPRITDRVHVAAETSGTATSVLFKSRIPQRVEGHVCESLKGFEEYDSTSSYLPPTNKPCYGMSSQGSFLMREKTFGKLDAGRCDEPFVNPGKSRLSSLEQRAVPVYFTSTNSHTFTNSINPEVTNKLTIIGSRERYNISSPYSGRITAERLQMKTKQLPRVSGISGSIPMGTMVTRPKRKTSLEECADTNICSTSDSLLKRRYEEDNCGNPDNHTESSFLHNVAASRLVEKPLEPNTSVELKIPSTTETYRPLNIAPASANDVIYTDELQYQVESKVSLMKKRPDISANDTNCNDSPVPQNPSMLVLQKNGLHGALYEPSRMVVPCNTPLNETFSIASRGTFTVSVATQTDLIMKNNAPVQTDNLICVKPAVAKILALFESQQTQLDALWNKQDEMQAIQKQTNVIRNEMLSILNEELNGEMFREGNNQSSDAGPGYSYNNSEECQVSRGPLRRSERIAAQTSVTAAGDGTFCGSKSVPLTPVHFKHCDSPSARSFTTLKSAKVYKELRTSFHFLKTPQSTRRLSARTPKNTPTRILSQRLQKQILSLYDSKL